MCQGQREHSDWRHNWYMVPFTSGGFSRRRLHDKAICTISECKGKKVDDYLPPLALRYRNEHRGTPFLGRETVTVKEISPGYQLHIPVKEPPGTPSTAVPDNPSDGPFDGHLGSSSERP